MVLVIHKVCVYLKSYLIGYSHLPLLDIGVFILITPFFCPFYKGVIYQEYNRVRLTETV